MRTWPVFFATLALLGLLRPEGISAQALNPPHLRELPAVERVKAELKGTTPRETALLQMGAFHQLQVVIKTLSGPREFGGLTPDETRLIQSYYEAAYYVGQEFEKTLATEEEKRLWRNRSPYRFDRSDRRFGVEGTQLFSRFLSEGLRNQFAAAVGLEQTQHKAIVEAQQREFDRANAEAAAYQKHNAGRGAEERAVARCAASGRNEMDCVGETLGKAVGDLLGNVDSSFKKAPIFGLRMGGAYGAPGNLGLAFYEGSVVVACGVLIPAGHAYDAGMKDGQVVVTVQVSPKPLILGYRTDGKLAGPGPVDVTGQVVVGTRSGTRYLTDGRSQPITETLYETRTVRCNANLLVASGPSPPEPTPGKVVFGILNQMAQNNSAPTPQGLRLSGEYGSRSGFDLEFHPESVIVGCRDAIIARPYTVQMQVGQVAVQVKHGAKPLALTYRQDGTLAGTGTVEVSGKVLVGKDANEQLVYAARSGSCPTGVLPPVR